MDIREISSYIEREVKDIKVTLHNAEMEKRTLGQWDRIRIVGRCCNIIRELNKLKIET